ncbi:MAG: rubredoxin [Chlorobaculum sp.]|jgi:rubredoxin|nr:rubredoxin [Chlorobaculum sp.]
MNIKESEPAQSDSQAWMCVECGYIYDPAEGDLDTNIRPGVPFDKLPADWNCPVCNHPRHQFSPFISQL